MNQIITLIVGTHLTKDSECGVDLYDHTSSVVLIKNSEKNILVDTGGRGRLSQIRKSLSELQMKTSDIDVVILTHFHLDHAYNISSFPNAEVLGWNHTWRSKSTFRFTNIEEKEVAGGIKIISTPGHTPEHLSVAVNGINDQTIIIAGDAINNSFLDYNEAKAFYYDKVLYEENARKILKLADRIIPGHGQEILPEQIKNFWKRFGE